MAQAILEKADPFLSDVTEAMDAQEARDILDSESITFPSILPYKPTGNQSQFHFISIKTMSCD